MEEHVRSRTRALAPAEQPVSAATRVNHLRGHGILQAELREDRLEGDMRAMSIDSQDQVSYTRADTVDRHAGVTSATKPSPHKRASRVYGFRLLLAPCGNVDK